QTERLIAHTRRSARAVGNVDGVDPHRLEIASAFYFLGRIDPLRRNNLHHRDKLTGRQLLTDTRAFLNRRGLNRGGSIALANYGSRSSLGAGNSNCRLHHANMLRRSSATAADKTDTGGDKLARVTRHVLRGTEVDVSAFDVARHACVRHGGKRSGGGGSQ